VPYGSIVTCKGAMGYAWMCNDVFVLRGFSLFLTVVRTSCRFCIRHAKLDSLLLGEYKHYKLRVLGHSLGAGCASILSVLLRPKFPVRCLAFSPPGCVFSKNLAQECSEWLTSYILNSDIVARLSVESFEALRNDMLETICRIKIPKYNVLGYGYHSIKNKSGLATANEETLYEKEEIKESPFKKQVEQFYELKAEVREKRGTASIEMCPPGMLIQLFRTADQTSYFSSFPGRINKSSKLESNSGYTARFVDMADIRKVIISATFLSDHDPIHVKKELQNLAFDFGLSPPYLDGLSGDV
jgi:sn1-specific diacylglycerol lipase